MTSECWIGSFATEQAALSVPIERIPTNLFEQGWCVSDGFVSDASAAALAQEARERYGSGAFHAAGIGAGARHRRREDIRGDHVLWLDEQETTPAQRDCLARFESLRLAANRELQLGLFEFECQLALYPRGASYRRHLDGFAGDDSRVLSCVLYLNQAWQPADGGQLRLHLPEQAGHVDVLPVAGRLVTFLSACFEHEVLPAQRDRLSLVGWFRARASTPAGAA